ncbi:MAG: 3-keto-5-aminohexanoate cleavage protein [Dichotomicrobium sp.]
MAKTLIMAAVNGGRRTKADHPRLPLTTEETAEAVAACARAGAAMAHVHVRDEAGRHVLDAAGYTQLFGRIGELAGADFLVQATTEALGRYTPEAQIDLIKMLRPAAVSIAVSELLPDPTEDAARARFRDLCRWMQAHGVWPQFILYKPDEVEVLLRLHADGDIPFAEPFLLFVLGRYRDGQIATPDDLPPFLDALGGAPATWMICAFGPREHACAQAAIAAGGHLRIGFENNFVMPDGSVAESNADLVALASEAARNSGRGVMTPADAASLRARLLR